MTLPTFSPSVSPSPGSNRRPETRILRADFGDGYSQSAPDGLNHRRKVLELRWDYLTKSDANYIDNFLEGRGGYKPFFFHHPHEPAAIKFICEDWNVTDLANNKCSVTATLKQSFNLES